MRIDRLPIPFRFTRGNRTVDMTDLVPANGIGATEVTLKNITIGTGGNCWGYPNIRQSEDKYVPIRYTVQTYLGRRRWRSVRILNPLGQIRMYPWHVIIIVNIVKNKAVLSWCFLRDYHKSSQQMYQVVFIMKISLLEFACVTVLWLCCYSWNSGQMWGQFSRMIGIVMLWLKINPVFLGG